MKVGPINYTIKVVSDSDLDGLGRTIFKEKIIEINENLPHEVLQATVMHEILHCINYFMPHEQVESLANSICQILMDNKGLKDLFYS